MKTHKPRYRWKGLIEGYPTHVELSKTVPQVLRYHPNKKELRSIGGEEEVVGRWGQQGMKQTCLTRAPRCKKDLRARKPCSQDMSQSLCQHITSSTATNPNPTNPLPILHQFFHQCRGGQNRTELRPRSVVCRPEDQRKAEMLCCSQYPPIAPKGAGYTKKCNGVW